MSKVVYRQGTKRDASGQPTTTGQPPWIPAAPPTAKQDQPVKQNTMNKPKNIVPLSKSFVKKDTLHVDKPASMEKEDDETGRLASPAGSVVTNNSAEIQSDSGAVVETSTSQTTTVIPGANNQTLPESAGPVFYSGITGSAGTSNISFTGKVGKGQHLVCDVCDVTVTSRVMMDAHLAGKKHKHKYEKLLKEGKLDSVVDSTQSNQEPTASWMTASEMMETSGSEQPSQGDGAAATAPAPVRVIQAPPPPKPRQGPVTTLAELYCGICEVYGSSPQNILDHVNGKKHQKKELAFRCGGFSNKINNSRQLTCDVCDTRIVGTQAMRAHLHGKKHLGKCHRLVVGKDFVVAKGQWAVPLNGWQDFDYREMERKRRPKDDGGWGIVREGKKAIGRGAAFIGPPTTEITPGGEIRPIGYGDFTKDVFW